MTKVFDIYMDEVEDVLIYNKATNQAEWVRLEGAILHIRQEPEIMWEPKAAKLELLTLLASDVPLDRVKLVLEYTT